uniref:RNA-directed RNA polymerase n=1 Tax=Murri virus TaxID=2689338 RepID=A0A6B9KG84_9VIRU|nr:RdRp [Murri virus]
MNLKFQGMNPLEKSRLSFAVLGTAIRLSKTPPHLMRDFSLLFQNDQQFVHDPSLTDSGPLIPLWVMLPCEIRQGRKGRLALLLFIELLYLSKYLGYAVYDQWMALNSDKYQLGSNPQLLKLWEERLMERRYYDTTLIDSAIIIGSKVLHRNKPGLYSAEAGPMGLDHYLSIRHIGFKVVRCQRGGYHIQLHNKRHITRAHLKPLNRMFPWLMFEDKQKTNLDLVSVVLQAIKRGNTVELQQAFDVCSIGSSNTIMTALAIAAIGNPSWGIMHSLMRKDGICCLTDDSRKHYFKCVSVAVRRTSRLPDGSRLSIKQVATLAYFELATGRAANLTDWADEKAKRCGPKLPLVNPYTGEDYLPLLKDELDVIVRQIVPNRDNWGSWEDFVMSRQRWASSGSAGGARIRIAGQAVRLNKHSYFEQTPTEEVLGWLDDEPVLAAVGSEKMESGKARAIYGTSPKDQTIVTYLISPLEKMMGRLPELISGHTGAHEVADVGKRLSQVSGKGVECTMLDYADFNYQHTLEAQELLYRTVAECVAIIGNADLNKAAEWVRAAQLNQIVKFPNEEAWQRSTQGMFSGVRSTDFTNTLLNLAYFRVAIRLVKQFTGLEPIELMNLHKGDDVWITNRSRLWAIELYRSMRASGFVFQDSKQLFDVDHGEFLRVLYTSEGAMGYVMRAVATLLIKPIQSVVEMAPQSKATALNSQIHLLYRRGLSLSACVILWWAIIPHALKMDRPGGGGVSIPVNIACKSFLDGGLDLGPPMTVAEQRANSAPVPAPVPCTEVLEQSIERHMSHDWIRQVSKILREEFDSAKLEDALHAANVSDSLRSEDRQRTLRRLEKDIIIWRAKLDPTAISDNGVRVPLDLGKGGSPIVQKAADVLSNALECYLKVGAEPGKPLNIVDTLIAGIAASPLRDIAGAKLALGLSTLAAARECLKSAGDKVIAQKASLWLESLVSVLGEEVAVCILEGIRGVGLSYEAILNPIMLSLVSKRATDYAILSADPIVVKDRHSWEQWVTTWMEQMVAEMCVQADLRDWSHF